VGIEMIGKRDFFLFFDYFLLLFVVLLGYEVVEVCSDECERNSGNEVE